MYIKQFNSTLSLSGESEKQKQPEMHEGGFQLSIDNLIHRAVYIVVCISFKIIQTTQFFMVSSDQKNS